jgi:hypothetical protein
MTDWIDSKLTGEWAEARSFFKGLDLGLKNKMSAALYLLTGRSLFRESGDLWRSSPCYSKRNGIIHRGGGAKRNDARHASMSPAESSRSWALMISAHPEPFYREQSPMTSILLTSHSPC